ncbi:MAG: type I DNA topoisomerase [Candidatus Marinimicrobia bacterium]|nr:type I DNA topoisomerase [Candidatus Neomarinimicrobiota bacterium]MCF7829197.1 type I DNA topoisomerase [Candidatus Neomarinimicrobiota bacterium]MCF7881150.1 type I DNA topoisomerase [Candidatus Neomarinimicrobiota bacterium]
MAKNLLIVESPSKAKTLKKYLGKDYDVKSSVGHIRDLPPKELGIDVENNFEPTYQTIRGKGKIIKELKKAARNSDSIYLGTDPDREGEAIAWHIAKILNGNKQDVHRVLFHEITKSGVKSGLADPHSINDNLVNAQQARRILDRLVGYKVSPFLWKTLYRGLSAGRVQSVALRIIVEREREIEAFEPDEYWSVHAQLKGENTDVFTSDLHKVNGEDPEIGSEEEVNEILSTLNEQDFIVDSIKKKTVSRKPYPPYTTSTLQQDAAYKLGFSPKKTMALAQRLYEGVEVNGETQGLITYMRTDSTRLANEALAGSRDAVKKWAGDKYLPKSPRQYASKKSQVQDAHEAIRPTVWNLPPDKIKGQLPNDHFKLYTLIWYRLLGSQMSPAKYARTTIDIAAGEEYQFRTSGSILKFDGYLKAYKRMPNGYEEDKDTDVPEDIEEGETLSLEEITPEQHFTKPPAHYNESSLIKELDNQGIGRPSTYSQIITTLYDRDYVNREGKQLIPTELGFTVCDVLVKHFPNIFNTKFTAQMEDELDKIEAGKDDWVDVVQDFYKPFNKSLEAVQSKSKDIKKSLQEGTGEKCEKCGREMVIKWGRNGKFLACSGFPDCKNTKPLEEQGPPEETDENCEKCGSTMVIKTGRYGRFMACSNYPECKNTKPIPLGIDCPEDGGDIVERRSRKGKVFYGCANYPDCEFAVWDKPVPHSCPNCDAEFLVEKNTKSKGEFFKCLNCKAEMEPENFTDEEVSDAKGAA